MDRRERFAGQQEAISAALNGRQAEIWTSLPGEVVSYDPVAVTVTVQPTVKGLVGTPDGETVAVDMPVLPDVPVQFPRGGGVTLTFPVKPGDECIVIFSSRCIDAWWQSGGSQIAPEFRMHDLSDGFAIIGPQSQAKKISNLSTTRAQIRSDDGQAFIEIDPNDHEIRAKTVGDMRAEVDGDVVAEVGGNVQATVAGNVEAVIQGELNGTATAWNFTGPVNITGALSVTDGITSGTDGTGSFDVNGSINATGDVTGDGVSLKSHHHTGVQSGSGTSGPPE